MRGLDANKKKSLASGGKNKRGGEKKDGWTARGAVERQSEDVDGGKNREATEGEGERGGLLKTGKKQRR